MSPSKSIFKHFNLEIIFDGYNNRCTKSLEDNKLVSYLGFPHGTMKKYETAKKHTCYKFWVLKFEIMNNKKKLDVNNFKHTEVEFKTFNFV